MPAYQSENGYRRSDSSFESRLNDLGSFVLYVVVPIWLCVMVWRKLSGSGPKREVFSSAEKEAYERAAFVKQELADVQKSVGPAKPDYSISLNAKPKS
jgi:hypothetical protein